MVEKIRYEWVVNLLMAGANIALESKKPFGSPPPPPPPLFALRPLKAGKITETYLPAYFRSSRWDSIKLSI